VRRRSGTRAAPPPPGWACGPPDVVGIGAQKAGTSWWWATLLDHPDLTGASGDQKELHYFDRFCDAPWTDSDGDRYHELFPRPEGTLCGEWTPRYVADVWAPPLLRRAAPDATLLLMLRDPVERLRSGLDHIRSRGGAIDADAVATAHARGRYGTQLGWVLEHFPSEQVVVLQYERCTAEPDAELRRTMQAVGLDPARHPGGRGRKVNATRGSEPLPDDLRAWARRSYEPEVRALLELTDAIDVARWPSFEHLAS
jgi:hypothetical protein